MEGSGVTNYSADRPSYGYSGATTEFDDELIRRGIVTETQVMLAKGASLSQAQNLVELKNQQVAPTDTELSAPLQEKSKPDGDSDDDSFLDDDDVEFMERYRQERMTELRQAAIGFGEPLHIDRTEWTRHVNEASKQTWVVVCLTSSDQHRTGCVEAAVTEVASRLPTIKFVFIPSHQAIENWPVENLPTLFLYREGKMQKQLVGLPCDLTTDDLEEMLEPICRAE